ncbi:MAG: hypothetical protein ABI597_09945 [Gammaproteobacteria bacterium]
MLFSHIEHYLSPKGMKLFPSWYEELKQIFLVQNGFISIKYAYDPNDSGCVHIWTEFSDEIKADKWAASQAKIDIQARLDSFRTKPMLVERYELMD